MKKMFGSFELFSIEELEGKQREIAIEQARERAEEILESELTDAMNQFKMLLMEAGFDTPQVYWQLFSQGAGAYFSGQVGDTSRLVRAIKKFLTPEARKVLKEIRRKGIGCNVAIKCFYYRSNSVCAVMEIDECDDVDKRGCIDFERAIKEWHDERAEKFFRSLEEIAQYYWKEEHVLEFIQQFKVRFFASGKIFCGDDSEKWEEIAGSYLRTVWKQGGREVYVSLGDLKISGISADLKIGEDLKYLRTDILVEGSLINNGNAQRRVYG